MTIEHQATPTLRRFENKIALVCGAASGIGAAVARRLAQEGAGLMLIGQQQDLLTQLASECAASSLACDVLQDAQVRDAVEATLARFGRIDVLINAAGLVLNDDAASIEDAVWQRLLDVNLGGTMRLMRAVLPSMLRQGSGAIVNIASVAAFNASAGMASYAASKAGVVALTRAASNAHGHAGVRVNALAPGWVDTPMSEREMQDMAKAQGISVDQARERTVARIALGRMASAAEMAACCAFLASDDASFVSGAVLVADGGARSSAAARAQ